MFPGASPGLDCWEVGGEQWVVEWRLGSVYISQWFEGGFASGAMRVCWEDGEHFLCHQDRCTQARTHKDAHIHKQAHRRTRTQLDNLGEEKGVEAICAQNSAESP